MHPASPSSPRRGCRYAWFVAMLAMALLSGCSSTPGSHAEAQASARQNHTHTVARGETLYSIAFIYGLDYKSLAKANGIDRNYTIYPGQVLKLDGTVPTAKSASAKPSAATAKKGQSAATVKAATTATATSASTAASQDGDSSVAWVWPAQGGILHAYSESGAVNKGIDISGNAGDAVVAASSGKVVYAGGGLVGYGQLVIIKHSEQFLSAYAHNRQLLVKEGDDVKSGQKIAEIGATGTDRVKLHFEIRRDGKPVDPEQYLPKR